MTVTYDDLISSEYQLLLSQMYKEQDWGGSGHKRKDIVLAFLDKCHAQTCLDYGCGQGKLKEALPSRITAEYDPGVTGKRALPAPADVVVCTDVLEHIEPDKLMAVMRHIRSLARKGIYLLIATRPANKDLPDGRNAHLIIEGADWWRAKLQEAGLPADTYTANDRELHVWVRLHQPNATPSVGK